MSKGDATTSYQVNNMPLASGVRTASLTEIWEELRAGIESVYSQQTMPKSTYMQLYSQVYNHCTSSSARQSSTATNLQPNRSTNIPSTSKSTKKSQGSTPSEGAQIIGCELYQKLQHFLESYLEKLQRVNFFVFFDKTFFALFHKKFYLVCIERHRFDGRRGLEVLHNQMGRVSVLKQGSERLLLLFEPSLGQKRK
jgi:hypothetical protein